MVAAMLWLGLMAGGIGMACLIWSILRPDQRIWPPKSYNRKFTIVMWSVTLSVFASAGWLGIAEWGTGAIPNLLRMIGACLMVLGNGLAFGGAARFGYDQTSGAEGTLRTTGLYSWSRNPQYLGDLSILFGWALLSAGTLVWAPVLIGMICFLLAPVAEEPWMQTTYGQPYSTYRNRVRRWL